ncbi:molybdenum cofactor synthesis domain protein [Necator americanus]|uniref:molybdopterin molybdotransferase n=1 Tax=Necator americanus TaxID=51031 RepID=W2TSV0_NECAM|nr:molybdenum cofactor synthesis domain protein [Necator americanus]ETN84196.1 molybdenum cofactor synthesis domain protein [Necator americanus]
MKANSLTNMLGEFVAIQKTPEFKPCSASMQELNRAVKEEKRTYSIKHRAERPRFSSVGDLSQEVSLNPTGEVTMRTLCDKRRERPSSLIERIRQRISPSRKSEVRIIDRNMRFSVVTVSDSSAAGKRKDLSGPAIVELIKNSERLLDAQVVSTVTIPDDRSLIAATLRERTNDSVSDSSAAGKRKDLSGPAIVELIKNSERLLDAQVVSTVTIPDDRSLIAATLRERTNDSDIIITTGGTGFAARDVTPEATVDVLERRCTGLEMALHSRSLAATPMAALSRAVAGISGHTLIVNFPGSVKAVRECWEVLEPVLNHAVDLLHDRDDGSVHQALANQTQSEGDK